LFEALGTREFPVAVVPAVDVPEVLDVPVPVAPVPEVVSVLVVVVAPVLVVSDCEAPVELWVVVLPATEALLASAILIDRVAVLVSGLAPARWFTTLTPI
jgi:hypothetical protein